MSSYKLRAGDNIAFLITLGESKLRPMGNSKETDIKGGLYYQNHYDFFGDKNFVSCQWNQKYAILMPEQCEEVIKTKKGDISTIKK